MSGLSPTMVAELAFVTKQQPDSIHEHDRDPERYVRMVARRSTVEGLISRGLAEPPIMTDYPMGGYRARLTDAGVEERRRIRAENAEVNRFLRRTATGTND